MIVWPLVDTRLGYRLVVRAFGLLVQLPGESMTKTEMTPFSEFIKLDGVFNPNEKFRGSLRGETTTGTEQGWDRCNTRSGHCRNSAYRIVGATSPGESHVGSDELLCSKWINHKPDDQEQGSGSRP